MLFRVFVFVLGVCMLSFGIATVTQAHLGTGSVSSLAYVLTLATGISIGTFVFATNLFFYIVEIAVDRKDIVKRALIQLPTTLLFSVCIDLAMPVAGLIAPETYWAKFVMVLCGTMVIGFGISSMVHARLAILPVEGAVLAIMHRFGGSFGTLRVMADVFLVTSAVILSFAVFGELQGVREGTIVAACLGGTFAKFFLKGWSKISHGHTAVD